MLSPFGDWYANEQLDWIGQISTSTVSYGNRHHIYMHIVVFRSLYSTNDYSFICLSHLKEGKNRAIYFIVSVWHCKNKLTWGASLVRFILLCVSAVAREIEKLNWWLRNVWPCLCQRPRWFVMSQQHPTANNGNARQRPEKDIKNMRGRVRIRRSHWVTL